MGEITGICIDCFDSAGDLRGKARTYEAVKSAVLMAGRFSVFEATDTPKDARIFDSLCRDPEVVTFKLGFPWTGVRRATDPRHPAEDCSNEEPGLMMEVGPDCKPMPVHFASKIRGDGAVSPACFKRPRALDLSRATWTNRREAVTCKRCLAVIVTSNL